MIIFVVWYFCRKVRVYSHFPAFDSIDLHNTLNESVATLCLIIIFGPENLHIPAFGSRSGRCLGVHTLSHTSANSTWVDNPFCKKCAFAL